MLRLMLNTLVSLQTLERWIERRNVQQKHCTILCAVPLRHQSITLARMRGASLLAKIILILVLAAGHTYNKLKAAPMQTQLCAIAHL